MDLIIETEGWAIVEASMCAKKDVGKYGIYGAYVYTKYELNLGKYSMKHLYTHKISLSQSEAGILVAYIT